MFWVFFFLNRPPSLVVADFGCGKAEISQSIPNPVYSFDLVAKNKFVTACDMSKVNRQTVGFKHKHESFPFPETTFCIVGQSL